MRNTGNAVLWTPLEIRLDPLKDETKTVFDTYLDLAEYLSQIDIYSARGRYGGKPWYYPKTEPVQITVFGK